MGVLLAFLVGWTIGAKAGPSGFDDVVTAAKSLKDSDEFAALVAITRTHVSASLSQLSRVVSGEVALPEPADLLEQVQRLTGRRPT